MFVLAVRFWMVVDALQRRSFCLIDNSVDKFNCNSRMLAVCVVQLELT